MHGAICMSEYIGLFQLTRPLQYGPPCGGVLPEECNTCAFLHKKQQPTAAVPAQLMVVVVALILGANLLVANEVKEFAREITFLDRI